MTAIVDKPFPVDPAGLLPPITPDTAPYWEALAGGRLALQVCDACARPRHPVAPVCPCCGGRGAAWTAMSGRGTVFSWVRYHRSFLPEFAPEMPYVVATVALEEGPRMFGRLRGLTEPPAIGGAVALAIERWPDGRCVPAFDYLGGKT